MSNNDNIVFRSMDEVMKKFFPKAWKREQIEKHGPFYGLVEEVMEQLEQKGD